MGEGDLPNPADPKEQSPRQEGISRLLLDRISSFGIFAGIAAPFDKQRSVGFLHAFLGAFPDMHRNLIPRLLKSGA